MQSRIFVHLCQPLFIKAFQGKKPFYGRIFQGLVSQGGGGIMKWDSVFDHSFIAVA